MNNNDITNMSANDIFKAYGCISLNEFEGLFNYEINKQYSDDANSSNQ